MTQDQPAPQLNPINIEHRLTSVEAVLVGVREQLGNMVTQMQIANGRTSKNEAAIRAEASDRERDTVALTDKIDGVSDGIAQRIKMEAAATEGFVKGQQSITVKMPWKQFSVGIGLVVALVGAVETGVRLFL